MASITRRLVLKFLGISGAVVGETVSAEFPPEFSAAPEVDQYIQPQAVGSVVLDWSDTHDRVWLGEKVWANPMEDWRVVEGTAQCQSDRGDRNLHLLTHQLTHPGGHFDMSVNLKRVAEGKKDGGVGFRIGVRSDINEHRANCFAPGGIAAGIIGGKLSLAGKILDDVAIEPEVTLRLQGQPKDGKCLLTLSAIDETGTAYAVIEHSVANDKILGNVALANDFGRLRWERNGHRYRFNRWRVAGDAFTVDENRKFGPLLWSMYSLSDSRSDEGFVLKLSALTGPLGEADNHDVELMVQQEDAWRSLGTAQLDPDAWTATFRIPQWNEKVATPFKLVYRMVGKSGKETEATWTGIIRENPRDRPLRIGALTCQNDYAFPYEPVAENLMRLDPDLLYFSGDQLYENHGGYGIIRQPAGPAILNYLRKFYQHGWSFREAMRDRPTLCLPDDHDVFQGNIWGEGGKKMSVTDGHASSKGGYIEPARMVNAVHKTNVAHHPDAFDATPVEQGISVYYGDMVYGGVGFAILSDRQFKSGPERVDTGGERADHVTHADFDTATLDKPGLVLLGQRQEAFLEQWVDDWRSHSMKVVLSQTVFAGVATHHGGYDDYLKADLDCGGWPQTPRDQAIRIIRQGKALHINGDQHLPTLVQYGIEKQRDAGWSYCTPAIAVGYPRWWRPDDIGMPHTNRPQHGLPQTGEYVDGLGNKVYVYAVGYPEVASKKNRYERAHQKASGFGMVTIDSKNETYTLEAFRFLVDATDGNPANQFDGWPLVVRKDDNGPQDDEG